MKTVIDESGRSQLVKKKRRRWQRLFVAIVVAVSVMVRIARNVDAVYQLIRHWLANL